MQFRLTESNALSNTDQDTAKDENTEFMIWGKSLDKCRDNGNGATNSHSPSPAKAISL